MTLIVVFCPFGHSKTALSVLQIASNSGMKCLSLVCVDIGRNSVACALSIALGFSTDEYELDVFSTTLTVGTALIGGILTVSGSESH